MCAFIQQHSSVLIHLCVYKTFVYVKSLGLCI